MLAIDCIAQVKHLRTLGVDQVAAAIRTHGLGLADNAVNVTYQFLACKVNMLSEVSLLTPSGWVATRVCTGVPLMAADLLTRHMHHAWERVRAPGQIPSRNNACLL